MVLKCDVHRKPLYQHPNNLMIERKGENVPVLMQIMTRAQQIIAEGKRVYETIRPTLELKFPNQYITIDPTSKEYFVDPSMSAAITKARARFPGREFYTTRIGQDTAMTMMR